MKMPIQETIVEMQAPKNKGVKFPRQENTIYTKEQGGKIPKTRKYDLSYLSSGFTSATVDGLEKPMCLPCMKILAADSMRPGKLERLLKTMHSEYVDLDITKFALVQNPFVDEQSDEFKALVQNPFVDEQSDEFKLTNIGKEKLIELSCDTSLKRKFQSETLVQFWLNTSDECNTLSSKVMLVALPFVTSCSILVEYK
ncbi:hypothetical protein QE152_g10128 [Popillia japonica]|uniref:Uncharacterized protein n=1 Tax=Popillia japonica TaxID=7064 RepID=A0AAW1LV98_POPJA